MQIRKNNPQITGRARQQRARNYGDVWNKLELTPSQLWIWRSVLLDKMPCSLVDMHGRYIRTCSLHHKVTVKQYSPFSICLYTMASGCKTDWLSQRK